MGKRELLLVTGFAFGRAFPTLFVFEEVFLVSTTRDVNFFGTTATAGTLTATAADDVATALTPGRHGAAGRAENLP